MRQVAVLLLIVAIAIFQPPGARADSSHIRIVRNAGIIDVYFGAGRFALPQSALLKWVKEAADAVCEYYGGMPLKRVVVRVSAAPGRGVGFATASEEGGCGLVEIPVGVRTTQRDLDDDWTLTHEMVHLAFPLVDSEHRWVAEGIATYVEPFGRLHTRALTAEKVWRDLVRELPQGNPKEGDRGLNHTPTWERTYWGGALFFLLADIEIHERTKGKKGLRDALRAIARQGGHIASDWTVEESFAVGDSATGVPVLQNLYAQMRARPVAVDLPELWRRLGVKDDGDTVTFSDTAPLSWIRQSITVGNL